MPGVWLVLWMMRPRSRSGPSRVRYEQMSLGLDAPLAHGALWPLGVIVRLALLGVMLLVMIQLFNGFSESLLNSFSATTHPVR